MALEVDIKKRFSDFSMEIAFTSDGNSLGILGGSGSGKSMTLKCIAGIEKPDEGRIVLDGTVLFDSAKKINVSPQKRNIGYLFQNYALFPTMTVEENIGIGVKEKKEKKAQIVEEQIRRFHLEGLEKRYPAQLSGGQQQRVALARIMAYNPGIIMLDEPFSALDSFLKDMMHQELLDILKDYTGKIIMVSHNRDEIFKFCSELAVVESGRVCLEGNTRDIFKNPKKVAAAKLTGCKNISRIRRIGLHELEALDWGIRLKTEEEIGSRITHVGMRAKYFVSSDDGTEENAMKVEFAEAAETPFEIHYLVRNAESSSSREIWWIKQKKQMDAEIMEGMPEYLIFLKEQLMLLES